MFEDRVAHHALMAVVGPTLDRALIDDTFACRVGKGSLAAVLRAQHHLRRYPWYAKLDIRKYFASIPHDRLIAAVAKKVGRGALSRAIERIIRGFEHTPGRGLPIGALTSQYLANFYLAPLDRFLVNDSRVKAVTRYMDDHVLWGTDAGATRAVLEAVRAFVQETLDLELKGDGFVQRSRAGLSFLGFRIYPGTLKLSRRRQRRYREARMRWEQAYASGQIDALGLQQGYASAFAITAHADAGRLSSSGPSTPAGTGGLGGSVMDVGRNAGYDSSRVAVRSIRTGLSEAGLGTTTRRTCARRTATRTTARTATTIWDFVWPERERWWENRRSTRPPSRHAGRQSGARKGQEGRCVRTPLDGGRERTGHSAPRFSFS